MERVRKRNFFVLDNSLFDLELDAYGFQLYAYLVCRAGKKGECRPSIATISRDLKMSENTVMKKLERLTARGMIDRKTCTTATKFGKARRSNNHYFIRPLEEAQERHFRAQLNRLAAEQQAT